MKLHERVRELLWGIPVTIASWLAPREQKSWALLLDGKQRYEGNIRALAHYLSQQPDTTVYLLNHRNDQPSDIADCHTINVVQGGSWAEMRARLKSQHVVFTHAHSKSLLNGRYALIHGLNLINVWHGIPLKALGNLIPGYRRDTLKKRLREGQSFHTFCVSSQLEKTFFAACYFFDASRIAVTGIPRNDLLVNNAAWDQRQRQIKIEIEQCCAGRAMLLYAPTWRDYDRQAVGLNRTDCEQLSQLMGQHNAVLAFRPHPLDNELFTSLIDGLPNLMLADAQRWEDTAVVLACTQALINDYSSIMVDYLLLQRPIIGFFWDYDVYSSKRGFLFDLPALFPGPIVKNADALQQQLAQLLSNELKMNETDTTLHQRMLALFHTHQDGRACERIVQRAYQDH